MHLHNGLESLFNTFSIGTKHRHSNRSIGHSFYTCILVHFVHIRWWPWPKIFALQDIEPDFWTCWAQLPPNLMQQRQYRSRIRDEPETFPWKIKDFSIKQNGTQLIRSFKSDIFNYIDSNRNHIIGISHHTGNFQRVGFTCVTLGMGQTQ